MPWSWGPETLVVAYWSADLWRSEGPTEWEHPNVGTVSKVGIVIVQGVHCQGFLSKSSELIGWESTKGHDKGIALVLHDRRVGLYRATHRVVSNVAKIIWTSTDIFGRDSELRVDHNAFMMSKNWLRRCDFLDQWRPDRRPSCRWHWGESLKKNKKVAPLVMKLNDLFFQRIEAKWLIQDKQFSYNQANVFFESIFKSSLCQSYNKLCIYFGLGRLLTHD